MAMIVRESEIVWRSDQWVLPTVLNALRIVKACISNFTLDDVLQLATTYPCGP